MIKQLSPNLHIDHDIESINVMTAFLRQILHVNIEEGGSRLKKSQRSFKARVYSYNSMDVTVLM